MTEKEVAERYLKCSAVAMEDCYVGGKWCATCMYRRDHDSDWNYYESNYCMCAEKKVAN